MTSQVLEGILTQETEGRRRPKALCYEDVLLMVVRHPETGEDVLAMAIKLIHHKGADNTQAVSKNALWLCFRWLTLSVPFSSLPPQGS